MVIVTEIRRRARLIIGPILGISLVGYFSYHLVQGDRGLTAWLTLTQQVREAKASLASIEAERVALDRRVNLMRPEHLDPDMLDERVRSTLNLIRPDEIVIFNAQIRR
jgi:cell division protein FtsB